MWPHKEGLGVQLSYGVDGNAVLKPKSAETAATLTDSTLAGVTKSNLAMSMLDFPRLQTDHPTLTHVHGARKSLVPPQSSSFDLTSRAYNDLKSVYIPQEILRSFSIEADTLTAPIVYDPAIGTLFQTHEIRTKRGNRYTKVLAYVSGESGTILNVSSISSTKKNIIHNHRAVEEVLIPSIDSPFQVEFSEPIKQIHFSSLVTAFDFVPSFLLIRTESNVYILSCFSNKNTNKSNNNIKINKNTANISNADNEIELNIIETINSSQLKGYSFADVSFNPWDYTQFAAIDVKGNFGIWNFQSRKKIVRKVKLQSTSSVYDAKELSNWKRISWSFDSNNIFVATRSSLTQFSIVRELIPEKLITLESWSHLLDIQKCEQYSFLLTSKELIWLSLVDKPVQRLMSWKHFLDESDPSLKLTVSEIGDNDGDKSNKTFLCMVYSQVSSLIFVYTFGLKNGKPYSLHDPYYLRRQGPIKGLYLTRLDKSFFHPFNDETESNDSLDMNISKSATNKFTLGLFELSPDLALSIDILNNRVGCEVSGHSASSKESSPIDQKVISTKSSFFKKFRKNDFEQIAKGLINNTALDKQGDDVADVQEYAYMLGRGITELTEGGDIIPIYRSLLEIAETSPSVINDLSEFDTMLEQLANFFKEQQVSTANFTKNSLLQKLGPFNNLAVNNVYDLYKVMCHLYLQDPLKKYNTDNQVKRASLLLGSSLFKAKANAENSSTYFQNCYDEELSKSSNKIQNILGNWQVENVGDSNEWGSSQATMPDLISSSIPQLRRASSKRPRHLLRSSQPSLRNRSSQPLQRTQSQLRTQVTSSQLSQVVDPSLTHQDNQRYNNMSQPVIGSSSQLTSSQLPDSQLATFNGSQITSSQVTTGKRPSQGLRRVKKKKKGGFA
ncbi:hypothetical protein CAAN1_02S05908 [[Candida] anglica]|uniref:RNA polymerase I-specific transcription initiation factor RRN6 n=1 Tax=[Candida] anglica TaxID=148631 RepID=A0ABP0EC71_9ASCO